MTITLFAVSFLALATLIASKVFEARVRKIKILTTLAIYGDRLIHNFVEASIFHYHRSREIIHIFFFDFLPSYLYEILVRSKDYVSRKYYSAGDEFRGRRVLRTNGSVSTFLQNIAEDKSSVKSRKA